MKIATGAEEAKMLSSKVEYLDADTRMIVQSIRYQMLQRQKDQLAVADNEDAAEEYVDADVEVEAAYAEATTAP